MEKNFNISYRNITLKDRVLVHEWLAKPHVSQWFYGEGLESTKKHFEEFLDGKGIMSYWIAFDGDIPVGMFITSEVDLDDPLRVWCSSKGVVITLDALIGNEDYLGKGLSHKLISDFLNDKFAHVSEVLIDPEIDNAKAIHVYKKAGFKSLDKFEPDYSDKIHMMMKLDRRDV